jgi:hypothetical protein
MAPAPAQSTLEGRDGLLNSAVTLSGVGVDTVGWNRGKKGEARRMTRWVIRLLPVCLLPLVLAQGCTPEMAQDVLEGFLGTFGDLVEVDPPDSTPPVVSLVFFDPTSGNKIVLKPGDSSKTISIKKSHRFFVVAVAEDLQGVKRLTVYPSSSVECEPVGGIGCKVLPLFTTHSMSSDAGPGETALTRFWLPRLVDGGMGACPPPCELKSVRISTFAEGENFSGLKATSPTVTFTVQH